MKYKMSHCLICGIKIYAYRDFRHTCSNACEKDLRIIKLESLEVPRTCLECGNIFYATHIKNKYCSETCKKENIKIKSEFTIFQRDKFKCIYCGKSSIEDGVKLHIEHITAISNGGKSELTNLITACQKCNVSKHANELPNDIKERILLILLERNKLLSKDHLIEIEKEIEFYRNSDNDRFMRISIKRRDAVKKQEYS